jgi:hypothetical protein
VKKGKIIDGQVIIVGTSSMSNPTLHQRFNMTFQYFLAMKFLLKQGYQIEHTHLGEPLGEFFSDIRASIATVVILSGATLEANIYERFQDVKDKILTINSFSLSKFANDWYDIKRRSNIPRKYKDFAGLTGITLNEMDIRFKEFEILIKVRNALVHYIPQWDFEKTPKEEIEISISQISSSITFSPYFPATDPYFPKRCMSSSFGQWAINSTLNFIKFFEDSIPIDNKYEYLRNDLQILHP